MRDALPESDVVVHVEPRERGVGLRQRVLSAALSEPLVVEAHDIAIFQRHGRATVSLHLKFPSELPLADAHAAAERVERVILSLRSVEAAQTHLEPLEQPIAERAAAGGELDDAEAGVRRLVRERTGEEPRHVRVLRTDAGPVVFLTLALGGAPSLTAAHALASDLEEALRQDRRDLAEVVVHTEPA